jgi:hypothetical protein
MADFNRISRFSSGGSNLVPIHRLAEYLPHSFSEPFEQAKLAHTPRQARMSARGRWARPGQWRRLTEEDMGIHAWLNERLAVLRYERHGLWPRAKRLLRTIARFMLWPFVRKERFNSI